MEKSINQLKVAQAKAYLEQYSDPQEARHQAAQNNEDIDSGQWLEAEKELHRE